MIRPRGIRQSPRQYRGQATRGHNVHLLSRILTHTHDRPFTKGTFNLAHRGFKGLCFIDCHVFHQLQLWLSISSSFTDFGTALNAFLVRVEESTQR